MKSSSHASNNSEERVLSTTNKRIFKLPITIPKRNTLQQHLKLSTVNTSITNTSSPSVVSPYVLSIANTMKLRMKAAVNTMVWNGNKRHAQSSSTVLPSTDTVTTTPMPLCDLQQQKQQLGLHQKKATPSTTLENGVLLKQYLTFAQEETGVILDLDLSTSTTATNDSFEATENHQSHWLASSGAALIESIVHNSRSKFSTEDLPEELPTTTVASTKRVTPQRRSSRPIKSTSVAVALKLEEKEKQIKKLERLQLQQRQKSRCLPHKPTTISNKNKQEYIAPTNSPTAVIQCICATPHEEFGAMVQCDDCTCWLHLECLALDEDALDETFRCPSCSISLGPGQHLTSAVTWRVAAQLKSQRLANRHNTTTEATTTNNDNGDPKIKHQSRRRRGYDRQRLQRNKHSLHRHHRLHQRKLKSRQVLLESTQDASHSSSSDTDDSMDNDQHHQTWMIPKMTIDPSISTTMTTSTGNVLVQRLNNHRTPSTATTGQNNISKYDNDDTDSSVDMDVDSDTTESDWESGDRYQHYQRHRSSIYDTDDYYSQDDMPASTSTRTYFSSINTTPSLTPSPSHTGSDTESPCEASTPLDEHFGHDDSYMQVMNNSNNNNNNKTSSNSITRIPTNSDVEQQTMLSTTATSACLDQESLIWLSHLAYLESLQSSTEQQWFNPHASDVFLCGDQQQQNRQKCNSTTPSLIGQEASENSDDNDYHQYSQLTRVPTLASRSDPPSTICSQDLSQFSFDAGPFWSPIR